MHTGCNPHSRARDRHRRPKLGTRGSGAAGLEPGLAALSGEARRRRPETESKRLRKPKKTSGQNRQSVDLLWRRGCWPNLIIPCGQIPHRDFKIPHKRSDVTVIYVPRHMAGGQHCMSKVSA